MSVQWTPKRRPLKILSALRKGAKSAPYAYNGWYLKTQKSVNVSPLDVKSTPSVRRNIVQDDPMPFSLVEMIRPKKVKYRLPTKQEMALLHTTFPTAITFRFEFPLLIIHCKEPPEKIPLTVGRVAAIFLSDKENYHPFPGTVGNPRNPDWLADDPYDSEAETELTFCSRVFRACNVNGFKPVSVSLYLGTLILELKEYVPTNKFPGKIGGVVPYYCNGVSAWSSRNVPQSRLIDPEGGNEDTSNYTSSGLNPGVRICGHKYAGTSGLIVRNRSTGERRLMVAEHVFKDTDEVFHPTTKLENRIGTITHRYPALDVALVRLDESVNYLNESYFDAPQCKRLVTSRYEGTAGQEWFYLDSGYTGLVPFLWTGVRMELREDITGPFHELKYDAQYIFLAMHINVGRLPNGVCGSLLVHDETDDPVSDGAVLGLFSWGDQNVVENLFVAVLDPLVDEGWEVESVDGGVGSAMEVTEGEISAQGEQKGKGT